MTTDRQKARHMSPPCISTGVLKKLEQEYIYIFSKYQEFNYFQSQMLKLKLVGVRDAPEIKFLG